jgi:hypothetical protein
METRGIDKSDGTLTMRRLGLPVLKSYKVEGKLLVTSRMMQIM